MELSEHINIKEPLYLNSKDDSIEEKKNSIKKILPYLSSKSNFSDNTWVFDLRMKTVNAATSSYSVYFKYIPLEHLEIVKLFVLLISIKSISNGCDFPTKILYLLKFIQKYNIKLKNFNLKYFKLYENHIIELKNERTGKNFHPDTIKKTWVVAKIFFSTIDWYSSLPYIKELENSKFRIKTIKYSTDNRQPLDNKILIKLDKYFSSIEIENHFKTVYWIMRLFPFRISEIINLSIDCIKQVNDDLVMLIYPVFKTNGGYTKPIIKNELLYIRDNHQKMVIDLIKVQQDIARSLQNNSEEKDFLFTYIAYDNKPHILRRSYLNVYLKRIKKILGIESELTLHQFRTTGATLRSEFGFTSIQLKELLNVKLDTISAYTKPRKEKLIKFQNDLINNKPKGYFKGRIINSNNKWSEEKIIKNPLAHKLPNMGFCSFENECGTHYDCLECEYLIPDLELMEYYRETALEQIKKSEYWEKKGNNLYQRDSLHRATLFTKLYEKILLIKDR